MPFQNILKPVATLCACAGFLVLAACASGPASDSIQVKMRGHETPPAQLGRLDVFVGKWRSSGEMRDLKTGAVTAFQSTSDARWDVNRRFLVQHGERTVGGVSSPYMSVTAWDPDRNTFRLWSFESDGSVVAGSDWRHDAPTGTWRITRQVGDTRIESVMKPSGDGRRLDVSSVVYGRASAGKVAEGTAFAERID